MSAAGRKEVHRAAAWSVVAAALLTIMKLVIGLITNSIGVISEALHSGLDFLAAGITLLAVRKASKEPDTEHQYGHGKIENFAALAETIILWATSGWIIYEALRRIAFGEYAEATIWGIAVMVISIVVDYERSQMLYKNARKHNSQALEADALHFRTDMLSSIVVLVGLSFVWLGFPIGDPLGAIGVSFVILYVSYNLARRAYNALVDHAPEGVSDKIHELCTQTPGVIECKRVRVRPSGADLFVDIIIVTDETVNLADAHGIADSIESELSEFAPRVDVVVHIEPAEGDIELYSELDISEQMLVMARRVPEIRNVHNIRVFEIANKLDIAADLEMSSDLTLDEAHAVSEKFEGGLRKLVRGIDSVTLHLETALTKDESRDLTEKSFDIVESVKEIISEFTPPIQYRKSTIKREKEGVAVLLDCTIPGDITLTESHEFAESIEKKILESIQVVKTVYIHFDPV